MRSINLLGVTGSIGQSAAKIILAQPDQFDVHLVSAHSKVKELAEAAIALGATHAVIGDVALLTELQGLLENYNIKASADLVTAIASVDVDVTLAAIVGIAGLAPLMEAIEHSKAVVIANKEPLVSAGPLVKAAAYKAGCVLLPADSEHNAIFQVYQEHRELKRIVLTASGGPFLNRSAQDVYSVRKEEALKHPNWSMGAKISIDSATMMNKALEVIEASVLFDLPSTQIDVLIHPQSVVHGMVEYGDGSILAQMGPSDMCTPIANVLAYPDSLQTPGKQLDLAQLCDLSFRTMDVDRFPAMRLAYEALNKGLHACIALNAANEVAVGAFLADQIAFGEIVTVVEAVMRSCAPSMFEAIQEIIDYDAKCRAAAQAFIQTELL